MTLSQAQKSRIDALFAEWNRKDRPGAVFAVVQDGETLHRGAFGMASIELGVPNGPKTVFRIASVTKQFVCLAAVLLAREGRLKIDDPIRKHLPDLPKAWPRIVIRDLMRNASGLRDHFTLAFLGGSTLAHQWTDEALHALILRQNGVNFRPNDRFLYCNTNFRLLTRIVETVAGKPLEEVLDARIFRPLGMSRTMLVRDRATLVPDFATAHLRRVDGGIVRAAFATSVNGDGGLVSCLDDLLRWNWAFDHAGPALVGAIRELYSLTPFNNGAPTSYGFGLALERYRGLMAVGHGGLLPGFRTEFLRIPQRRLAIVVIANVDAIDPYATSRQIADIVLERDREIEPLVSARPKAAWAGRWADAKNGTVVDIKVEKGALFADMWGGWTHLRPLPGGRWKAFRGVFDLTLRFREDAVEADVGAGSVHRLTRVGRVKTGAKAYVGGWRSEELDANYVIAEDRRGLRVDVRGPAGSAGPWRLEPVAPDFFLLRGSAGPFAFAATLRFIREGARASGFTVSAARARNFLFRRA
jgi:CubicO group peptidase (beta-lactamase class C family)